jgi:CheY-like chemotaxis protein
MDIGLPGMSGDQATAKLKAEPTTKDIPVVVHTAFGRGPSTKRAIEAGAAEVLCKPVRIPDLKTILEKYLRGTDQLPSDSLESA